MYGTLGHYKIGIRSSVGTRGRSMTDTCVDHSGFALVVYIASVYFPCTMPKWGTTITYPIPVLLSYGASTIGFRAIGFKRSQVGMYGTKYKLFQNSFNT